MRYIVLDENPITASRILQRVMQGKNICTGKTWREVKMFFSPNGTGKFCSMLTNVDVHACCIYIIIQTGDGFLLRFSVDRCWRRRQSYRDVVRHSRNVSPFFSRFSFLSLSRSPAEENYSPREMTLFHGDVNPRDVSLPSSK